MPVRSPQGELVAAGITLLEAAQRSLEEVSRPAFNVEFQQPPMEESSALVPGVGGALDDILCEQYERTGGHDTCVRLQGITLQIPADRQPLSLPQGEGTATPLPRR